MHSRACVKSTWDQRVSGTREHMSCPFESSHAGSFPSSEACCMRTGRPTYGHCTLRGTSLPATYWRASALHLNRYAPRLSLVLSKRQSLLCCHRCAAPSQATPLRMPPSFHCGSTAIADAVPSRSAAPHASGARLRHGWQSATRPGQGHARALQ